MKKYKVMTRQERLESINKPQTKVTQKKVCPACNEDGTCNNDVVLTHTPLPWKIEGHVDRMIIKAKNYTVCEMRTGSLLPNGDDAAFIVRAVNAHEELVEAAKEALARLQSIIGDQSEIVPKGIQGKLKQAIAKAEGRV